MVGVITPAIIHGNAISNKPGAREITDFHLHGNEPVDIYYYCLSNKLILIAENSEFSKQASAPEWLRNVLDKSKKYVYRKAVKGKNSWVIVAD